MIKFMITFDKDKEAKWLTEMANEGWAMKSFFGGFYTFEECEKGKYQYQIDLCDKFLAVSDNYRDFMADNEIEIVQQWGIWVILRKLSSAGEFELYSDVDSQIDHYTKIHRIFAGITLLDFCILIYEIYLASSLHHVIGWAIVFFIMAVLVLFISLTMKFKNIVYDLKARKTGIIDTKKNATLSPLLAIGFSFNAISMVMESGRNPKLFVQIMAIVFMLSGIIDTLKKVKKANE